MFLNVVLHFSLHLMLHIEGIIAHSGGFSLAKEQVYMLESLNLSLRCLVLENISFSIVMQRIIRHISPVPLLVQMEKDSLQETV